MWAQWSIWGIMIWVKKRCFKLTSQAGVDLCGLTWAQLQKEQWDESRSRRKAEEKLNLQRSVELNHLQQNVLELDKSRTACCRQIYACAIFLPFLHDGFNCTPRDIQWLINVLLSIPYLVLFNNFFAELVVVFFCVHGAVFAQNTHVPVIGLSRYGCIYTTINNYNQTHSLDSGDLHLPYCVTS